MFWAILTMSLYTDMTKSKVTLPKVNLLTYYNDSGLIQFSSFLIYKKKILRISDDGKNNVAHWWMNNPMQNL